MKLKDAQMRRLQGKVRDFMQQEQDLSIRLNQVEKRDQDLMTKLESAITFGKVLFTMKPIFSESQKKLQSQLHSAFKEELDSQN